MIRANKADRSRPPVYETGRPRHCRPDVTARTAAGTGRKRNVLHERYAAGRCNRTLTWVIGLLAHGC